MDVHQDYDFLIVGGGMAAHAAASGIREQGARGSIGILGEEVTAPFPRPLLSKDLWNDPDPEARAREVDLDTAGRTGACLHLNTRVVSIDVDRKIAEAADGDTFGFARLLVATGARPRRLDGLPPSDRALYYRSLTDYHCLRSLAGGGVEVAAVGGGYLSNEIAAALSDQDCHVTIAHPAGVLNAARFPASLAYSFEELFVDAGVRVLGDVEVRSGRQDGDRVHLSLSSGDDLDVDVAVLSLGVQPASEVVGSSVVLAEDGGIVVDEHLVTSAPDVFAAGDVAEYPDRILGRTRVEHVDNAEAMGAAAGRIMAGSTETYDHTPMFYSDVLDHGYEAIGTIDTALETVTDPVDDDSTIVYYLDDEQVRGVLLWDYEGGLDAARVLLAQHSRPADVSDLVGAVR